MKKIIILALIVMLAMTVILSACSTSTKGRSPADGTWDYVEFWNGGTLIWANNGNGKVTIETTESANHSFVSSEGTWMEYKITCNGKTIYILDCESLAIIYWND